VNVADTFPEAITTEAGTVADFELLVRVTVIAAGAAAVKVTAPVLEAPPERTVGLRLRESNVGGLTFKFAVWDAPTKVALIVTVLATVTDLVLTTKVDEAWPDGTVTLTGTVATDVRLLDRVTSAPTDPAGPLSVTVPVDEFPPETLVGLSVSETKDSGVSINDAVFETDP